MELVASIPQYLKGLKDTRLSSLALRGPNEFFDYHRISRPKGSNEAFQRITYNTRYFSGNYGIIAAALAIYAILSDTLFMFAVAFLVFGFIAINKWAPEPMQVGDHVVTQKSLYTALFVIGIPMLWFSGPFSIIFWVIGASSVFILTHACLMEPGIESEYGSLEEGL